MQESTVFISYPFSDTDANALLGLVRVVTSRLRRVAIVDGKSLDLRRDFSGAISDFVRDKVSCLIAILLDTPSSITNVIYEVGVAVGAGKELILISDSIERIPAMLRSHHAIIFERSDLNWRQELEILLEQTLREYLQLPSDHLVEDKLARRYQAEEIARLRCHEKVTAAMETIRAADLAKARALLEHLLDREPDNADAHYLLADTLHLTALSRSHPADREEFYTLELKSAVAALEAAPGHVLALNVKARALLRLGRIDEAREILHNLRETDPQFSVPVYNSACLEALTGNLADAIRDLKAAIGMNEAWRQLAKGDPDFSNLRSNSNWMEVVYEFRKS